MIFIALCELHICFIITLYASEFLSYISQPIKPLFISVGCVLLQILIYFLLFLFNIFITSPQIQPFHHITTVVSSKNI